MRTRRATKATSQAPTARVTSGRHLFSYSFVRPAFQRLSVAVGRFMDSNAPTVAGGRVNGQQVCFINRVGRVTVFNVVRLRVWDGVLGSATGLEGPAVARDEEGPDSGVVNRYFVILSRVIEKLSQVFYCFYGYKEGDFGTVVDFDVFALYRSSVGRGGAFVLMALTPGFGPFVAEGVRIAFNVVREGDGGAVRVQVVYSILLITDGLWDPGGTLCDHFRNFATCRLAPDAGGPLCNL